ncbi:DUF1800 domain-containing protein [Trinickia dabaoshanensis]|uniref:DUF1800 domain-containing protein n=1 Tax=Trinickia dabaoshanensis TaxID=564714 RepID=A0A2N7VH54_9BURK|nr:DUF1800 domain-containing protein [Trinickia dabaoshanensis]PMS16482.1 DUF1800 domain-containing protein [Trinickia dabaoshanensis]
MTDSPHLSEAAIALNRFGLGARADEPPPPDARAWLLAQFDRFDPKPAAWAALPDTPAVEQAFGAARQQVASGADQDAKLAARKMLREEVRDDYRDAVDARVRSALSTDTPFVERLVHFWSNHFAISTEKPQVAALAGAFEAEAIRPHVLGRFEDMLFAVERHPAMQVYLDQVSSVGPDSRAGMRADAKGAKRGLNENLAREIMELHTLGVRTGYTQSDVTEFARALTGWSIVGPKGMGGTPGSFIFREPQHEPGERTIMGRVYAQTGEAQAGAVLHDLAAAPATANHVAAKLARHFAGDNPSRALVARLAQAFNSSGGDLPTVYRALIASPEPWADTPLKFKTPWDWTLSTLRGLGTNELGGAKAAPLLAQLGQPVWRPGSPAGYDDIAASWAAPDALMRRVELAQRIAARVGDRVDARALAPKLTADSLAPATALAIARAESAQTALALLLVSPDFQRR